MKLFKIISGSFLMLALAGSASAQIPGSPRFHKKQGPVVPVVIFDHTCIATDPGWSFVGGQNPASGAACQFLLAAKSSAVNITGGVATKSFNVVVGTTYTVTMGTGHTNNSSSIPTKCKVEILNSSNVVVASRTDIGAYNTFVTTTFTFTATTTTMSVKVSDTSAGLTNNCDGRLVAMKIGT